MPQLVRKRRAQADASPSPPAHRRRSRVASTSPNPNGDGDGYDDGEYGDAGGSHDQMVKKLVRLALASEYSRQPLRRADISFKVLHPHGRAFKVVFEEAQKHLQDVFGMALTELPIKEKHTIAQKRAAQRSGNGASQSNSTSSKAYILTSTLPKNMRHFAILSPPKIPTVDAEAGYTGLYSFVVSIIMLSQGGRVSEGKLERYLQKANADEVVLEGEKTDKIMKRMEREGYIVKVREREAGGEESVDWVVGPRGKVEVGERGVAAMVKTIYGKRDVDMEELEDRLERSLGEGTFVKNFTKDTDGSGQEETRNQPEREAETASRRAKGVRGQPQPTPGRSSRRTGGVVDDESEGDDDDEEEEDEDEEGREEEEEEGEEEEEDDDE